MVDEEVNDLLGRDFQRQRQSQDAADRGARDQVEPRGERRIDLALDVRDHLGRVQPTESSARQGEDLKGRGLIVDHVRWV